MWEELEEACRTLKHQPDSLTPYDLRALLRRAQRYIELQQTLIDGSTVSGTVARQVLEDKW